MEFRLLGPLQAVEGDAPVALGGPKQRALLARLLLDANRTVSVARLVDDLWGDGAPDSAAKMVQIYVSRLRKVLPDGVLQTQPPGYLVEVGPERLDLSRFRTLRADGRAALEAGDPAGAARLLREALEIWRGPALAEFSEPFAGVEGAHLEELRLACLEDRIDADLAGARPGDVVGELEALTAQHPLRERLHRQLMLGLYQSGRQAEALAAYDRFRRMLDDELGIEPSQALKRLQLGILNQDPSLESGPRPQPERPGSRSLPDVAVAAPRLFGRADELARLENALESASRGDGRTTLVQGRAGIGKSRLVAELAHVARGGGATVLTGRCIQLVGVGLPYLPFAEALRPVSEAAAAARLAGELRELPRLVPELAGGGAPEGDGGDRSDSRLRLFQETALLLRRLADDEPVVLTLEDLHWADASTLDLFAFLVRELASAAVLLVGTYRGKALRPGDVLQRVASDLVSAQAATVLELEPLERDAVEALVREASESAPDALVDAIFERSGGNPFFARQLLHASLRGEAALPPALRDMLLADIARLHAGARSVLRVAAAAGSGVSYEFLTALTPLDELALAEALRQAVEHDVLVPDQASGTFRFRHELFAEAVYGTLLPGEREVLHERIARSLMEKPWLATSGADAAEAAQHWAAARRPVEALAASLRATKEAEEVSGLTEALGHVERVLELWDQVPDAERLTGLALPAVLERAADLATMSEGSRSVIDFRVLVGVLDVDEWVDAEAVAERLGVTAEESAERLEAFAKAGLVERKDRRYRAAPLAMGEARRLFPAAVVLESVAVRRSPPFDSSSLEALRQANARLRAARDDPAAALAADDDFHRHLTGRCGNEEILSALAPIKRALLRYERVFMSDASRVERSAAQHDAIIEALERGDHAEAAQLLRENLAHGLPDLSDVVEAVT